MTSADARSNHGLLAIAWAAEFPYRACLALIGASIFDTLDGRLARALNAQTALGELEGRPAPVALVSQGADACPSCRLALSPICLSFATPSQSAARSTICLPDRK